MKPISILLLWITAIIGAAILGLVTNAINAQVSDLYFRTILGWQNVTDIKRAIVAQGIFEGLICGVVLATLFLAVIAFVSKARCDYLLGLRFIAGLIGTAFLLWVVGGVLAILLVSLSPEFYRSHFIGVPESMPDRIRYAWVGGSIWGVQFGGAAATFIFMALFRARWRLSHATEV
jgi:tetrahydromethanopterin S-methyltransferase subunit F